MAKIKHERFKNINFCDTVVADNTVDCLNVMQHVEN